MISMTIWNSSVSGRLCGVRLKVLAWICVKMLNWMGIFQKRIKLLLISISGLIVMDKQESLYNLIVCKTKHRKHLLT